MTAPTPDETLRERIARTIHDSERTWPTWENEEAGLREGWRAAADAVLAVLAEQHGDEWETTTEYAVEFPGGIVHVSDDRGDAEDWVQWIVDGSLVTREVRRGPWEPCPEQGDDRGTEPGGSDS